MSKRHTEPMHPNVFQFEIVETPQFVAAAENYLPATQRQALFWLLAMNPFVGTESADVRGVFSVPWGDREQHLIHYCVSNLGNEIILYLIETVELDKAKKDDDKKLLSSGGELAKDLRRAGMGVGVKELWDLFKGLL